MGIDLVCVDSVRDSIAAHGSRYLARVYTAAELEDCRAPSGIDAKRLAARFAAKEAAFKALRVGDQSVSWRDVETRRDPDGSVKLSLSGSAARLARRSRISHLSLSLSYGRGSAAAVVIAEIRETADT